MLRDILEAGEVDRPRSASGESMAGAGWAAGRTILKQLDLA
jgi:hypothetical protein